MLLIATLLMAQAAAADSADPLAKARPRGPCVAVLVDSPQLQTAPDRDLFSATGILDLRFQTLLRGVLAGPRTLELRLYTPRGHLYQILTVPFTTEPPPITNAGGAEPRSRWVAGYPRPLVEQAADLVKHKGQPYHRVSALFPVAGTLITTNSLYGRWQVEPHLDGAAAPCGPSGTFALQP